MSDLDAFRDALITAGTVIAKSIAMGDSSDAKGVRRQALAVLDITYALDSLERAARKQTDDQAAAG